MPTRRFSRKVKDVIRYGLTPNNVFKLGYTGRIITTTGAQYLNYLMESAAVPSLAVSELYKTSDLKLIQAAFAPEITSLEDATFEVINWVQEYQFHNHTNTEVTLELYRVKPRHAIGPPLTTGTKTNPDPMGCINRSCANMNKGVGSAAITPTTYGITPFACSAFTQSYIIQKVTKMKFEPGEFKKFRFVGPRNKHINMSRYWDITANSATLLAEPDKYRCLLARAYGSPVNQTGDATKVNICEVGINFSMMETVHVSAGYINYKTYSYNVGAASFPALAAPITMSSASGTGVTVASV